MINYDNKIFITRSNSENGDTDENTVFYYKQSGSTVTATYKGGSIKSGFLEASADHYGNLQMQYYHTNINNQLVTGICTSTPDLLPNGKLRIIEDWQWTCNKFEKGRSILEEIDLETFSEEEFNLESSTSYSF
ncbi:n-acetylglutamate synthase [Labilibacter marinus]|uniref:n-acetylglutamate synthase n=1 Tax=Labilibacter marinus TaxID=1477105 RepID=UPI0018E949DE|nr:n-acetylglutamate synthase [Labilibacter marinus]